MAFYENLLLYRLSSVPFVVILLEEAELNLAYNLGLLAYSLLIALFELVFPLYFKSLVSAYLKNYILLINILRPVLRILKRGKYKPTIVK